MVEAYEILKLFALEGLFGDDAKEMDPLAEVPGSPQRIARVERANDRKLPAIVADPPISGPFRNGAGTVRDLTAIDPSKVQVVDRSLVHFISAEAVVSAASCAFAAIDRKGGLGSA